MQYIEDGLPKDISSTKVKLYLLVSVQSLVCIAQQLLKLLALDSWLYIKIRC